MIFKEIRIKNSSTYTHRTLDALEKDLIKFQDPNITLLEEYDVVFQIISRCRALRISPQALLMVRQDVFTTEVEPILKEISPIKEVKTIVVTCANPSCQKPAKEGSKYCNSKSSSCRVAVSKLSK
jgi:hypothetical protein